MRKKEEIERKNNNKIIYYLSNNLKFTLIKLLCKAKVTEMNVEN